MEQLKLIELFSGIGAQLRGLRNTGLYEVLPIATSEIDKDAVLSYAAIHHGMNENMLDNFIRNNCVSTADYQEMADALTKLNIGYDFIKDKPYNWQKFVKTKNKDLPKYYLACRMTNNLGDISRIKKLPYADMVSWSSPCNDISVAGRQAGIIQGETRSGLLYESLRLFKQMVDDGIPPKYLLFENVKAILSKKFVAQFQSAVIDSLDELGYNTYYSVINAAECGIPQNRERVFALSIRKDIDTGFTFPQPFDTGICINDILDDDVSDGYFYRDDQMSKLVSDLKANGKLENYPTQHKTSADRGIICNRKAM